MMILNGMKLILDDQGNHLDSNTIGLESFRSFRGPLFHKPVLNWSGTFFAVSYSEPALDLIHTLIPQDSVAVSKVVKISVEMASFSVKI